jgi:hypothetical protein
MGMPLDEFDKMTYTLAQDGSIEIPPIKIKGEIVIKLTKEGLGKTSLAAEETK